MSTSTGLPAGQFGQLNPLRTDVDSSYRALDGDSETHTAWKHSSTGISNTFEMSCNTHGNTGYSSNLSLDGRAFPKPKQSVYPGHPIGPIAERHTGTRTTLRKTLLDPNTAFSTRILREGLPSGPVSKRSHTSTLTSTTSPPSPPVSKMSPPSPLASNTSPQSPPAPTRNPWMGKHST